MATSLTLPPTPFGGIPIQPGIYRDIPEDIYHRWSAASNSRLSLVKRSPAHLKAEIDQPKAPTEGKIIGRACHSSILEPAIFGTSFTIAGQCDAVTGKKEQCRNSGLAYVEGFGWACGTHLKGLPSPITDGRTVLSTDDYALCVNLREAVRSHASAGALLDCSTERELSIVWRDEETGLLCKARLDGYVPPGTIPGGAILDLKSTTDASKAAFSRDIFTYGYHRQGAFYLAGTAAVGLEAQHFIQVPVEKARPFAVATYRLRDDALKLARTEIAPLLRLYKQCVDTNTWPAYSESIEDVSVPEWAYAKVEVELLASEAA